MIDWLTVVLAYNGPVISKTLLVRDDQSGAVELKGQRPKYVNDSGAGGCAVATTPTELYLSLNPAMFLTGQNLCGSNDICELLLCVLAKVFRLLDLPYPLVSQRAIMNGEFEVKRVDCTFHFKVGTDDDVRAWLEAMEQSAHARRRGRGLFSPLMCALTYGIKQGEDGKLHGSRRSTLKMYNKYNEIKRHRKIDSTLKRFLMGNCEGEVRVEACYRATELKKLGFSSGKSWDQKSAWFLLKLWIDRLEIVGNMLVNDFKVSSMPNAVRTTYLVWKSGEDVRAAMSKTTFYRRRAELLEYGIDIAIPRKVKEQGAKVIPVVSVLEATPVDEIQRERFFWSLYNAG